MKMNKKVSVKNWFIFSFLFLMTPFLEASQIQKIRGNRVLIQIDGDTFSSGDQVFALDDSGRKRASLKISKVQGNKATAVILKGKAQEGMVVSAGGTSSKRTSSSGGGSGKLTGIMGGLNLNSMGLSYQGTSTAYSGNSFSVLGFMDIPLSKSFVLRTKGGLDSFEVVSQGSGASFTYIGFEGGLNWHLSPSFWVGGGGAFLLTMAKSSSIYGLDANASTNSFFFAGLGSNISLSGGKVIPLSLEYALYPGGAGVTASSVLLRAGYAWSF